MTGSALSVYMATATRSHAGRLAQRCTGGSLLALAIMFAAPVAAQDSGEPEIVVNAYRPARTIDASTKTTTPPRETPQSVSVITREELDARGVQSLNEATRYVAGVLPESQGMDNRIDDMYIRGFDAGGFASNIMLDGLRMPSDSSSSWNHASYNNWNMERVEVLKGPSSVLYGHLAPGGMVNQISKTPRAGQRQILQLLTDEYGKYQAAFDLGQADESGNIGARFVALFKDGGTQLDHVDHQQWFVAPSVTFGMNSRTRLTLQAFYQEDGGGSTFQFLPYQGSVIPGADGYIDNRTFLGEPAWNVYDRTVWAVGWQFEHRFSDALKFSQNARFTHVDSLYRATVVYGVRGQTVANPNILTGGRIMPRRAVQGEGDSDGHALDTRLEGRFTTGGLEHIMLAGFDWQRTNWDFLRKMAAVSQTAIQIDIYDPVYTYFDFAPTLVNQVGTSETDSQSGAYLQDQIAAGNWRLTLSGRYDWTKINSLNTLTQVRVRSENEAFSGRVGLLHAFPNGLSPYVSFSQAFQPAIGTARDGSAFEAITADQWEVGLKYEPRSIDGMITLSAFDLRQKNVLTADPLNTGAEAFQVQTGEVRIRGIELEGRVTPVPGLSLIGAATLFDSRVTRDTTNLGNRMIRVPDGMGSLWLDYSFQRGALEGLSLAAGARYVDETYGDLANTLRINAYRLFDTAVRYNLGRIGGAKALLSINGSNLADKRYVATCSALTACYYGSGRTLTGSIRLSW